MSRPDKPDQYQSYVELVPLRTGEAAGPGPVASRLSRLSAALRRSLLALLMVGLPTLLAVLYYGVIASDRYDSVSQFVVRNFNQSNTVALNALIQTSGVGRPADEARAINAYLESRDAMRLLDEQMDLRAMLSRPEVDLSWRLPGVLSRRTDTEALYGRYRDLVTVDYDSSTGITTLTVEAFRPEDSMRMAQILLDGSETLVNRLNARARRDLVASAQEEVDLSKARATAARENLTAFRNREEEIDPTRASQSVLETVGKLAYELAQTRAQFAELQRVSPQSPQINALRGRIAALEDQIARQRNQFGGTADALAPRIAEYERLVLEREFADQVLASSMHSLELARLDAQRQELYLERIVQPGTADYPAAPQRMLMILFVFGLSLCVFAIIRTIINNARAHRPS